MTIDTLKQAAQKLRALERMVARHLQAAPGSCDELAAALEAMAEMQPVGQVLTEAERLRCDLRGGPFIWFCMPAPGALLYAAPVPTPEPRTLNVDELAQEIRRVDGNHDLGAGRLAEALMSFLRKHIATPEHDAKVRDAAIDAALSILDDMYTKEKLRTGKYPMPLPVGYMNATRGAYERIEALKSTGADHAK